MAQDWAPSIITGTAGLLGVCIGGGITWFREWLRERHVTARESAYLSVLVLAHLERFVDGCMDVARDDGTAFGRPAGANGSHEPTIPTPSFKPLELEVNWKVLPAPIMSAVLTLPSSIEQLDRKLAAERENYDPPAYTDFFFERRRGYATLGLRAIEICMDLSSHANLKNPVTALRDRERQVYFNDCIVALDLMKRRAHARAPR